MIGRLRLLVWSVGLAGTAVALLHGVAWPTGDDPAVAVMAIVRVVAGGLAAYLFVVTLLAVRLPRLAPRFARRLVVAVAGGAMLLGPVAASAATTAGPPPGVEAPVLHRVEPTTTRAVAPLPTPPASAPEPRGAKRVVVAPGDHLWGIAERELASRLGRAPTDEEIVPFWESLIEANRDQLVDADLIFPEQVLRLPS